MFKSERRVPSKERKHSLQSEAFAHPWKSALRSCGAVSIVLLVPIMVIVCVLVNLKQDRELCRLRAELEHVDNMMHRSMLYSFQVGAWVSIKKMSNNSLAPPMWVQEEGTTDVSLQLSMAIEDFELAFHRTVKRVRSLRPVRPLVKLFLQSAYAYVPRVSKTQTEGITNDPADAPLDLRMSREKRAQYDPRFHDVLLAIKNCQRELSRNMRYTIIISSCFVGIFAILLVFLQLCDLDNIKMSGSNSSREADSQGHKVPSKCDDKDPVVAIV